MSSSSIEEQSCQTSDTSKKNIKVETNPRWVRVRVGGETIADSKGVLTLHERGHLPVYYFPESDVRQDLLIPSSHSTHCPLKGDASYWSIQVGDRVIENAVWSYLTPIPESEAIRGYYAFYWNKVDQWLEEEEEIFVHPRDPYKRVDAIASSRHIQIVLNGVTVADSKRPVIVFETGVPVRYYLPKEDIREEVLTASALLTSCPYKGTASYLNATIEGQLYENIVWSYQNPIPEIPKIAGLYSFYNERVDAVYVDGEKEPEPQWYRSALDFFNANEV
ncbi:MULTISPECIES: DUF427 domain-containing protein [unclassified Paenibacillus]|uniref:DUF427 domain-containing protein n=1 Tax=unclassified Paenibacillus TaxID=185978 RepID=UPI00070F3FE5|nr:MULTISPECIES: DUF427 domain-containing protein [unclassified Paenibacillus]KQX48934.1 hypothetical protein ASD40_12340 [Paenibacillus sp. Root444D2]KRE36552.1 hypothetical protein ASG85_10375 [Paenibacillus sp. Soil724D2]